MNGDSKDVNHWQHDHEFGQSAKKPGELRTIIVIVITATMMVVEIAAGIAYGSMALLADGLHMASHAAALTVSAFAYIYARRHADDPQFSFGTGKVNSLGGFAGAVLLAVFAMIMVWESIHRLLDPVFIAFNSAILVAIIGLVINGASVVILGHDSSGPHDEHDHHDHNLRSAYLHVLADTMTSVLAIGALLAGKYLQLQWMDPMMGIVGATLVTWWSIGLIRSTSRVLLDRQGPQDIRDKIRVSIESHDDISVTDLHLWSIGPNIYAVIVSIVTQDPKPAYDYKRLIPQDMGLVHITVELHDLDGDSK